MAGHIRRMTCDRYHIITDAETGSEVLPNNVFGNEIHRGAEASAHVREDPVTIAYTIGNCLHKECNISSFWNIADLL